MIQNQIEDTMYDPDLSAYATLHGTTLVSTAKAILNLVGKALETLNPISSAQAAEPLQNKIASAVTYLDANALPHSASNCGHFVAQALRAGGFDWVNVNYAKDFGPQLAALGFTPLSNTAYTPQPGDVAVIQPYAGGNAAGHVAMWDGKNWVLDFVQTNKVVGSLSGYSPYPGPGYRMKMPSFVIYRR